MNIKTNISKMPSPQELEKRLLTYSKIDYIMNYNDDFSKVYHFDDKNWVKEGFFFRIDDSGGDHYHILISPDGVIVKGFGHETEMSPYNFEEDNIPDLIRVHDFYKDTPPALLHLLSDEALEPDLATFCMWKKPEDAGWSYTSIDIPPDWEDGTSDFSDYIFDLDEYKKWFEDYYEVAIDSNILSEIYNGGIITEELLNQLPTEYGTKELLADYSKNF